MRGIFKEVLMGFMAGIGGVKILDVKIPGFGHTGGMGAEEFWLGRLGGYFDVDGTEFTFGVNGVEYDDLFHEFGIFPV